MVVERMGNWLRQSPIFPTTYKTLAMPAFPKKPNAGARGSHPHKPLVYETSGLRGWAAAFESQCK
eukprot:COSAG03_NODE_26039_length_261_cov_66.888889_1_plen_64_part_10